MSSKRRKLEAVVAQLQLQHGPRAIRRAPEAPAPVPRVPTTFPALDAALDGGLPRGRISEIIGPATSGKLTLAAKTIAAAHNPGAASRSHPDHVTTRPQDYKTTRLPDHRTTRPPDQDASLAAWIDLGRTCDPDYLNRCGVALDRLLVVRPDAAADALALTLHLVETNALAVLVCDGLAAGYPASPETTPADESLLAGALARLAAVAPRTGTAILFLTEPEARFQGLAHAAAVCLAIRRERWIMRGHDVRGYEGQVEVLKNRLGRAGAVAPIRIVFNGTVRGEGL